MAVVLITIEERNGVKMAIFSVPLGDREPVFMRVEETPYENQNRGVVMVDARKFLKLWRASPEDLQREIARGNPDSWRQERDFHYAEDGFSEGFANPVPLARVGYSEFDRTSVSYKFLRFGRQEQTRRVRYVSFLDGITRTMWLMSHGCRAFPVECRISSAHHLHRAAAVAGTQLFTVRDVQQGLIPVNHPPPYH